MAHHESLMTLIALLQDTRLPHVAEWQMLPRRARANLRLARLWRLQLPVLVLQPLEDGP